MLFRTLGKLANWTQGQSGKNIRRQSAMALELYNGCVEQARSPAFYVRMQVPDTLDGRFDMILVHVHLLVRRLKNIEKNDIGQAVTEIMFTDMDQSLREMGVGDSAVGKRVRKMTDAYYSRGVAYHQALDAGGNALEEALRTRIYRSVEDPGDAVGMLANYIRDAIADLDDQSGPDFEVGQVRFPVLTGT